MRGKPYTTEQIKWLEVNVKNTAFIELTRRFNEHFNENRSYKAIKGTCARYRLANGRDMRFAEGRGGWNKGKKMSYKSEESRRRALATAFKKGDMPHNTLQIGDEKQVDGYTYVKVRDDPKVKACKNWRPKHHVVYEQNYGPVGKDCIVVFLDNDRTNFDPDNLMMVHKRTLPYFLHKYGYTDDIEINRTNFLLSEVESTAVYMERGME